jgi:hypothetical protein
MGRVVEKGCGGKCILESRSYVTAVRGVQSCPDLAAVDWSFPHGNIRERPVRRNQDTLAFADERESLVIEAEGA